MTLIQAPVERCFKLSVSIDLHLAAGRTREEAVDGVTSGLIGPGQRVTWQGRHFGLSFKHESEIDVWRPYSFFRDVMVDGAFKMFEHDHHFAAMNDGTRLRDEMRFAAPMGRWGRMAEVMLLRGHMTKYLQERNALLKRVAESQEWRQYLDGQPELDMRVYQGGMGEVEGDGREYAGS